MARPKKQTEPKEITVLVSPTLQPLLAKTLGERAEIQKQRQELTRIETALTDKFHSMLVSFIEGKGYSIGDYNIVEYEDHGRNLKIQAKETK